MSKKKANAVTVIFAIMLLVIDVCMYKLFRIGFYSLTGLLSVVGFWKFGEMFSDWLSATPETELDVPEFIKDEELLPEDFTATYESIKAEMERA